MFNSNNGYSLSDIAAVTGTNRNGDGMWGGDGAWWVIILLVLFAGGWGNGNGFGGFGGGSGGADGTVTRAAIYDGFTTNGIENGIRGIQQGLCDGFYAMNTGMLNGFNGVTNAICDAGYATQQGFNTTNVALMQAQNALSTQLANCCCDTRATIQQASFDNAQGMNALTRQVADCCCETGRQIERGFADINYNMATSAGALQTSLANSTRDIIDSQNAGTRAILDYLCQEKIADLQSENQALRLAASQQAQNNYLISELAPKLPVPAYAVPNPFVPYGYSNCNTCC